MAKKIRPKVGMTISGWETRVREATMAKTAMTRAKANQRNTENINVIII